MKVQYSPEKAEEILREEFRRNHTFFEALERVKEGMKPTIHEERALEGLWTVWELYGDEKK